MDGNIKQVKISPIQKDKFTYILAYAAPKSKITLQVITTIIII
jgi:hypothetical protein